MREDQLTKDLVHAWEVVVGENVRWEVEKRALPTGTVLAKLTVNKVVYDLLGSLPRFLAQRLVEVEEQRDADLKEKRRQQTLQ